MFITYIQFLLCVILLSVQLECGSSPGLPKLSSLIAGLQGKASAPHRGRQSDPEGIGSLLQDLQPLRLTQALKNTIITNGLFLQVLKIVARTAAGLAPSN